MANRLGHLVAAALASCAAAAPGVCAEPIHKVGGQIRVRPYPMDAKFKNPAWPAEMENGFWERANHAIRAYADSDGGATTGEHEKWGYPKAMFAILAGNREANLRYLQAGDGEHPHTLNVDLYWCFCLKNQPRKYFWFGKHAGMLDGGYLERMRKAMDIWTKEDPKPTLELYAQVNHPDPEVGRCALKLLGRLRLPKKDIPALLAKSRYEPFRRHMQSILPKLGDEDFGGRYDKWYEWAKLICDGDWQVYEEYERLANPRPHPTYGHGTGPIGGAWDPKTRGLWADGRNTDNLRSMRETAVYLFAEEAGNETVRKLYKEKLTRFVVGLYHVGMGEWDSENYHAHTIAPWLGLYDFAADGQVKLLGKAALDWLTAAAALKYYRGGFGGPTKRDYGGGNKVFGAGVSHMMYLYFGDCPLVDPEPHYDDVHAVMSTYRPPLAVAALARKDFARPVELHNTKPTYSHWLPGADEKPAFWETLLFGRTYYLGTCAAEGGAGDVGPFKLLAFNSKRGCDFFVAAAGSKFNTMRSGDQHGQYRNLAVQLAANQKNFSFLLPRTANIEAAGGVWFVRMEKTWIALYPIHLGDRKLGGVGGKEGAKYKEEAVLSAKVTGGPYAGYALEVGEEPTSYEAFKAAVKSKGRCDLSGIDKGTVVLTGTDGRVLRMTLSSDSDLPIVERDGKRREWLKELDLYKPAGASGPISLGWKAGRLRVEAGGHVFEQTVTPDGTVTWSCK